MEKGDEKMMTVKDVMDFLQISRSSVYRLIKKKAFPTYKVEGNTRFKREDIEEYLNKQKQ
jgi:excisionase family DNA binding protein